MQRTIQPARVEGSLSMPGDKSIAHRSLILAALAEGRSEIRGLPGSQDVKSTMRCLRTLGVQAGGEPGDELLSIEGRGLRGLSAPQFVLDAGNSGTTARMLLGVLAAQGFDASVDGDASLRGRPMGRVIDPLRLMGASFEPLLEPGRLPLRVMGAELQNCEIEAAVASAQVKSAILLAGLCSGQGCTVIEKLPTRDHTEIMLRRMGASVETSGRTVRLAATEKLEPQSFSIPGDISSAAYFVSAALLCPDSSIELPGVLLNQARRGLLDHLSAMGADIRVSEEELNGGEAVGTIRAQSSKLRAVAINPGQVPAMIDELPLLAVLASQAEGRTTLRGAHELRVKESDRIRAIAEGLRALGGTIEELADGFIIEGPQRLSGGTAGSCGDHRIAMALAVAGLCAENESTISGAQCVAVSYPGFWEDLGRVVQP